MQKKVKKWLGIVCIILVIGVISLITIRYMTSNPEKNQEKGLVLSDDAEVWNKDVEDKSEGKEGIKIPGYGDITMSAEEDTWKLTLLNPEGNPCYFQYSLEIAETGEEIYQSDLIEPGKAITEFAVKNVPDKGNYELYLNIHTFSIDENKEPLNGAQVKAKLHII